MNPLVKETTETVSTLLNFPPPLNLKHQPIFMLPYSHFDGPDADNTDAKYLSIGLAQWNEDELSGKVWRFSENGGKWSRFSEEIPLHRVVDLCILLVKTLFEGKNDPAALPAETFENQHEGLELKKLIKELPKGSDELLEQVKNRLRKLNEIMNKANIF